MKSVKLQLLVTLAAVAVAGAIVAVKGLPPTKTLLRAAGDNDLQAVRRSLRWGADATIAEEQGGGYTALHYAAVWNRKDIAELLITCGAHVNARDNGGSTPLALVRDREIAEVLVARGADVNARNREGWTPLYWAAYRGWKDVAELLVAKAADVNARNDTGETPLHAAVAHSETQIAELLIAKGADANVRNAEGKTPLAVAVESRHEDCVDLLRRHGAKE